MSLFQTQRVLAATPAAIFAAIADPQRLARWWGPAGFRNSFDRFEFVPGGLWIFTMHGPDGSNYPNEARFKTIEPAQQVVIEHTNAPLFELSISLVPVDGGTRVDWRQSFDDAAFAQAVRHIIEPANEQNLDRLAAELGA